MKLRLERYRFAANSTLGKLYVNGNQQCYVLEDKTRELEDTPVAEWKVAGATAIPRGTYKVAIDYSPHFGRMLPHVLDVPGFDGIRIHPGNTDADTEGCLLVGGIPTNDDFIPNSRATFDALFGLIEQSEQDGETVIVEIA